MNSPHGINQAYSEFFSSWYNEHLNDSKQALFVTLTFEHEARRRQRRQAEGLSKGTFEMEAFKQLYLMACRQLVGRNYHRNCNRDRLPHVAAFLDAEGSRHWRSPGDLINLHIHSIWIIDEHESEPFKEMMSLNGFEGDRLRSLSFDEVDVRSIERSSGSTKVVSYASKLIGFTNAELPLGRDFEIFPLARR